MLAIMNMCLGRGSAEAERRVVQEGLSKGGDD